MTSTLRRNGEGKQEASQEYDLGRIEISTIDDLRRIHDFMAFLDCFPFENRDDFGVDYYHVMFKEKIYSYGWPNYHLIGDISFAVWSDGDIIYKLPQYEAPICCNSNWVPYKKYE